MLYPISYNTDNDIDEFEIGKEYSLMISLDYSEFDSVSVGAFIDVDQNIEGYEDTVRFSGSKIEYKFIPKKIGPNLIDGIFYEFDASIPDLDDAYGGERPFRFEYKAIERN